MSADLDLADIRTRDASWTANYAHMHRSDGYGQAAADRRKLLSEIERLRNPWIKVDERMPKSGEYVLVFVRNSLGMTRRIRAFYAAKFTEETDGDFDEFAEYSEAVDKYYTPEGWYECNEYEETHWRVDDPVSHWMPLPPSPEQDTR